MKIEVETSVEAPANNFQGRGRKPSTPLTCQDKSSSHTQLNTKQTKAENQTSSAMSKLTIRRTTRSMTAALLARRNLSIGDVSVIELSDSSDVRPNPTTIGPSMLDLKYVSIFADKEVDSQQVNREDSQEIDRKPK